MGIHILLRTYWAIVLPPYEYGCFIQHQIIEGKEGIRNISTTYCLSIEKILSQYIRCFLTLINLPYVSLYHNMSHRIISISCHISYHILSYKIWWIYWVQSFLIIYVLFLDFFIWFVAILRPSVSEDKVINGENIGPSPMRHHAFI